MKGSRFMAVLIMVFILAAVSGCTSVRTGGQAVPAGAVFPSSAGRTTGATSPATGSPADGSPESVVYRYFADTDAGRYDAVVDAFWLSYMPEISLSPEEYRSTMVRALEDANGYGGSGIQIRDVRITGKEKYRLTVEDFDGSQALFGKYGEMDAWNMTVSWTQVRSMPANGQGGRHVQGAAERMTGPVLVVFADGDWKLWPYVG